MRLQRVSRARGVQTDGELFSIAHPSTGNQSDQRCLARADVDWMCEEQDTSLSSSYGCSPYDSIHPNLQTDSETRVDREH